MDSRDVDEDQDWLWSDDTSSEDQDDCDDDRDSAYTASEILFSEQQAPFSLKPIWVEDMKAGAVTQSSTPKLQTEFSSKLRVQAALQHVKPLCLAEIRILVWQTVTKYIDRHGAKMISGKIWRPDLDYLPLDPDNTETWAAVCGGSPHLRREYENTIQSHHTAMLSALHHLHSDAAGWVWLQQHEPSLCSSCARAAIADGAPASRPALCQCWFCVHSTTGKVEFSQAGGHIVLHRAAKRHSHLYQIQQWLIATLSAACLPVCGEMPGLGLDDVGPELLLRPVCDPLTKCSFRDGLAEWYHDCFRPRALRTRATSASAGQHVLQVVRQYLPPSLRTAVSAEHIEAEYRIYSRPSTRRNTAIAAMAGAEAAMAFVTAMLAEFRGFITVKLCDASMCNTFEAAVEVVREVEMAAQHLPVPTVKAAVTRHTQALVHYFELFVQGAGVTEAGTALSNQPTICQPLTIQHQLEALKQKSVLIVQLAQQQMATTKSIWSQQSLAIALVALEQLVAGIQDSCNTVGFEGLMAVRTVQSAARVAYKSAKNDQAARASIQAKVHSGRWYRWDVGQAQMVESATTMIKAALARVVAQSGERSQAVTPCEWWAFHTWVVAYLIMATVPLRQRNYLTACCSCLQPADAVLEGGQVTTPSSGTAPPLPVPRYTLQYGFLPHKTSAHQVAQCQLLPDCLSLLVHLDRKLYTAMQAHVVATRAVLLDSASTCDLRSTGLCERVATASYDQLPLWLGLDGKAMSCNDQYRIMRTIGMAVLGIPKFASHIVRTSFACYMIDTVEATEEDVATAAMLMLCKARTLVEHYLLASSQRVSKRGYELVKKMAAGTPALGRLQDTLCMDHCEATAASQLQAGVRWSTSCVTNTAIPLLECGECLHDLSLGKQTPASPGPHPSKRLKANTTPSQSASATQKKQKGPPQQQRQSLSFDTNSSSDEEEHKNQGASELVPQWRFNDDAHLVWCLLETTTDTKALQSPLQQLMQVSASQLAASALLAAVIRCTSLSASSQQPEQVAFSRLRAVVHSELDEQPQESLLTQLCRFCDPTRCIHDDTAVTRARLQRVLHQVAIRFVRELAQPPRSEGAAGAVRRLRWLLRCLSEMSIAGHTLQSLITTCDSASGTNVEHWRYVIAVLRAVQPRFMAAGPERQIAPRQNRAGWCVEKHGVWRVWDGYLKAASLSGQRSTPARVLRHALLVSVAVFNEVESQRPSPGPLPYDASSRYTGTNEEARQAKLQFSLAPFLRFRCGDLAAALQKLFRPGVLFNSSTGNSLLKAFVALKRGYSNNSNRFTKILELTSLKSAVSTSVLEASLTQLSACLLRIVPDVWAALRDHNSERAMEGATAVVNALEKQLQETFTTLQGDGTAVERVSQPAAAPSGSPKHRENIAAEPSHTDEGQADQITAHINRSAESQQHSETTNPFG